MGSENHEEEIYYIDFFFLFWGVLYIGTTCDGEAIMHLLWLPVVDEDSLLPIIRSLLRLLLAKMTPHQLGQQEMACSFPKVSI